MFFLSSVLHMFAHLQYGKELNCVNRCDKVVVTRMELREKPQWNQEARHTNKRKQLLKNVRIAAAVSLCLGAGALVYTHIPQQAEAVMSHLTAGFEYDETLGRLQYVSNILPESAMVFLSTEESLGEDGVVPVSAQTAHAWSAEEPWLEYEVIGDVVSCQDGEVMTVVRNSRDTYTVRVLHDHGYESLYSGLSSVYASEGDTVYAGDQLGTAAGFAAFELRKDGLSVQPSFSGI